MVHQPQRRLGDPHRPFVDLDPVHRVDVHRGYMLDVEHALAVVEQLLQNFDFEQTQFAVRDHQEVATAAGRVQEPQLSQSFLKPLQFRLVAAGPAKLGSQGVQEQRADHAQDVAFRRVMPADLPALFRLHDSLEQRPEDGGRNPAPVESRAGEQRVPHVAVELGETQSFGEQLAVDVRQIGEQFVQIGLPIFPGRIQHLEQPRQVNPQVRSVRRRAVLQVIGERVSLENAGVFGKQAKQNSHQKPLQRVPRIAAGLQRVVQIAQNLHGLDIDGVLIFLRMLFIAGDERKLVDVPMQIPQFKVPRLALLEIVQGDAGEVRDDDVARQLVVAAFVLQVLDVLDRLQVGQGQTLAARLVFGQQDALPEQVNVGVRALQGLDGLLETGDDATTQAENLKELIPK